MCFNLPSQLFPIKTIMNGKIYLCFFWIISKWNLYRPSPWNDIEAWYLIMCAPQPWKMSSMLHLHNKKNVVECVDYEYYGQTRAVEKKCALIGVALGQRQFYVFFNSPQTRTGYIKANRACDLCGQIAHAILLSIINEVGARLRLSYFLNY